MAISTKRREPQARSLATRERLLDGAIECLVRYGYSGTTTLTLSKVSGVSRGGQQFHFPTREALVVTAVEHLAGRVVASMREGAGRISDDADPVAAMVELLWDGFSGPWFVAAYELWVAARTDDALRAVFVPAEERTGRAVLKLCLETLPPSITQQEDFTFNLGCTINLMNGLALTQFTREDPKLVSFTLRKCQRLLAGE